MLTYYNYLLIHDLSGYKSISNAPPNVVHEIVFYKIIFTKCLRKNPFAPVKI